MNNQGNNNDNEKISFNMPLSDIMYATFRKEAEKFSELADNDPDAAASLNGILILSRKMKDGSMKSKQMAYGNHSDVIEVMLHTAVKLVKCSIDPKSDLLFREKLHHTLVKYFANEVSYELIENFNQEENYIEDEI